MCKKNSTGNDSVRTRRYIKITVYLVLQCVLLLEAILLLHMENQTKTHEHENSAETFNKTKNDLLSTITLLIRKEDKLVTDNNKITNELHQLNEKEKLLSKYLREMDGWRCYQSDLYYISSEEKNWADSKQDCLNRGANLTIINSTEEQDFFKNGGEFWIGLTNMDGTWKWINGIKQTSGFSSWASGEPKEHTMKDCAVILKLQDKSEWYDYSCSYTFKWICERKPS